MPDSYLDARPVRVPVLLQPDVGRRGWQTLHELARLHGRPPREQAVVLLRWALWRALEGDNTELTLAQWAEHLDTSESLEPVA